MKTNLAQCESFTNRITMAKYLFFSMMPYKKDELGNDIQ